MQQRPGAAAGAAGAAVHGGRWRRHSLAALPSQSVVSEGRSARSTCTPPLKSAWIAWAGAKPRQNGLRGPEGRDARAGTGLDQRVGRSRRRPGHPAQRRWLPRAPRLQPWLHPAVVHRDRCGVAVSTAPVARSLPPAGAATAATAASVDLAIGVPRPMLCSESFAIKNLEECRCGSGMSGWFEAASK